MIKTPFFWSSLNPLSLALIPFSWLYSAGGLIRWKSTKPVKVSVPVICVGNLVVGGAGKTPTAIAIAHWLAERGKKPFFITRGYKGKLTGPVRVEPETHSVDDVGDEALILATHYPTIMGSDRVKDAELAISQGADVIIMDDGYQNPTLAKDIALVVVDGAYGFGNKLIMPAGPLREPITRGFKRAQAVILVNDDTANVAKQLPSHLPVLRGRTRPVICSFPKAPKAVVAFAGLAHPQKLFRTLGSIGCNIVETVAFPDHHRYTDSDIATLNAKAEKQGATLATTAKDAVRLPADLRKTMLIMDVRILFDDPEPLEMLLNSLVKA